MWSTALEKLYLADSWAHHDGWVGLLGWLTRNIVSPQMAQSAPSDPGDEFHTLLLEAPLPGPRPSE